MRLINDVFYVLYLHCVPGVVLYSIYYTRPAHQSERRKKKLRLTLKTYVFARCSCLPCTYDHLYHSYHCYRYHYHHHYYCFYVLSLYIQFMIVSAYYEFKMMYTLNEFACIAASDGNFCVRVLVFFLRCHILDLAEASASDAAAHSTCAEGDPVHHSIRP